MNNTVFTGVRRKNGRDKKHSPVVLILLHQAPVLAVALCEVPVYVLKHSQYQQGYISQLILSSLGAKTISLPIPELLSSAGM